MAGSFGLLAWTAHRGAEFWIQPDFRLNSAIGLDVGWHLAGPDDAPAAALPAADTHADDEPMAARRCQEHLPLQPRAAWEL
eukprot:2442893-Amphidinium_carterae.1